MHHRWGSSFLRQRWHGEFNRIRYRHHDESVFLYAFDLIELDGDDLRSVPLTVRKTMLAHILARSAPGLRLNDHLEEEEEDGPLVFAHACKLGLEGIVSKRRDLPYNSGLLPHWIKSKNPNAPAVKREFEEDWSGRNVGVLANIEVFDDQTGRTSLVLPLQGVSAYK